MEELSNKEALETPRGRNTGLVSPCISVCEIDESSGFCKGCLRSRKEIKGWLRGTRIEQLAILEVLKARREKINKKLGIFSHRSERTRRRRQYL